MNRGIISTKPKNTCSDCATRVQTYLKSIEEWREALLASQAREAELLEFIRSISPADLPERPRARRSIILAKYKEMSE